MQTVYLFNESLFFLPKLKQAAKKYFGKNPGGPTAVFLSLTKGLGELGVDYKINPKKPKQIKTACVVSGVQTLTWAIRQKQEGNIQQIIAGPNIAVLPKEAGRVLESPLIDKIIVPSLWVKECYASLAPRLENKIFIWAAGVDLPELEEREKDLDFLVFIKNSNRLADDIINYLRRKNYRFSILNYGKFNQPQYFEFLKISKNLIYISESESQGLAMFEAWAQNAPTLVWDRGYMQYGNYRFKGNTAAPYLTQTTGKTFRDFEDFKSALPQFLNQKFSPRDWVKNNATNKIAAEKYLQIINA